MLSMEALKNNVMQIYNDLLNVDHKNERILVGISGAPGSGKSTLSRALSCKINKSEHVAAVIPMDGYHLDDSLLEDVGLLKQKGAPETFDFVGFKHLLLRVKNEDEVVYPVFDREREISIAGTGLIKKNIRIVIVEGNYLLFDEEPWSCLSELWDYSVFLDLELSVLERRLVDRWIDHGFSRAEAQQKAVGNDIQNAKRVIASRIQATRIISDA
jgi:pantothenate kinase